MAEFRMPSLGADMEAGTLVEWMVKPGDKVSRGDIVAVVETQKGAIEIEVFEAGEVEEILVPLGTEVPVGMPLARIRGIPRRKFQPLRQNLVRPCRPRQRNPPPRSERRLRRQLLKRTGPRQPRANWHT
jgi:pyruvate dehydrogenase E2 component (dihydrolipoamide acetyltransferase)